MPETKPSNSKPNYAFCQFLNPQEAHQGKPCDCFIRKYFDWASVLSYPAVTLDSTSLTSKTASSSRQEVHLTDDELRVTKPNSRIEIYETYRKDNPINRPIQVFYTDKQRVKKKSIPVALVRGLWHRVEINRQERTTILAEPLPSIHDFDFEIRTDQQTLDLSSIADALPTPTESTTALPTRPAPPRAPEPTICKKVTLF